METRQNRILGYHLRRSIKYWQVTLKATCLRKEKVMYALLTKRQVKKAG